LLSPSFFKALDERQEREGEGGREGPFLPPLMAPGRVMRKRSRRRELPKCGRRRRMEKRSLSCQASVKGKRFQVRFPPVPSFLTFVRSFIVFGLSEVNDELSRQGRSCLRIDCGKERSRRLLIFSLVLFMHSQSPEK